MEFSGLFVLCRYKFVFGERIKSATVTLDFLENGVRAKFGFAVNLDDSILI